MILLYRITHCFFVFAVPYVIGTALLSSCFIPLKQDVKKSLMAAALLIVAILLTATEVLAWEMPYGLGLTLYNLIQITAAGLVVMHFYQGTWHRKALCLFTMFGLLMITELIQVFVVYVSWNDGGAVAVAETGQSMLLTLALIIAIKIWRKEKGLSMGRGLLLLQILIVSICLLGAAILSVSSVVNGVMQWPETVSIVAFMLLMGLYYINFEITDATYRQNQEFQLQQQRHKLMEEYYNRVESHQAEIRTIKHDLKNQLIALSAHSDTSDYFSNLIRRLDEQTEFDFTAHSGMNALLGAKMQQAKKNGILCEFEVSIPADIQIEETDLAALSGNILDNAIEACHNTTEKKYIRFRCVYRGGALIIESENSTDGTVKDLQTRKTDKLSHGLGTKSIRAIVEKYNGQMRHEFSSRHFSLRTTMFEKI